MSKLVDSDLIALYEQAREERRWEPLIAPFFHLKCSEYNDKPVPSFGLEPAGYTIRMDPDSIRGVMPLPRGQNWVISPHNQETQSKSYWKEIPIEGRVVLLPGHLYLASSLEKFNLPPNVLGLCHGKSTYSRLGLIMNVTPLEPGWSGFLTIEMFNHNPNAVELLVHGGILQIQFELLDSTPTQTYQGNYQNQEAGVVPARVQALPSSHRSSS